MDTLFTTYSNCELYNKLADDWSSGPASPGRFLKNVSRFKRYHCHLYVTKSSFRPALPTKHSILLIEIENNKCTTRSEENCSDIKLEERLKAAKFNKKVKLFEKTVKIR